MPFTIAQLTVFWTSQAQIGLTACTRVHMAAEGFTTPDNFEDFPEKDNLEGLFKKLLKPAKIPGVGANAQPQEVATFVIPAKSKNLSAWGTNNCALLQNGGTHD